VLLVHVTIAIRAALSVAAQPGSGRGEAPVTSFVTDAAALAAAGRFLDAARRMQLAVIELLLRRRVLTLARSDPTDAPRPAARGDLARRGAWRADRAHRPHRALLVPR
jgi:hypothetical protein